jgi:hypothetical protein
VSAKLIVDTICMSGFTAGCFYHAISCIVRPQKELLALALRVKNENNYDQE